MVEFTPFKKLGDIEAESGPMFLFGFQKVITFLYAVVTIMLPKKIYEIDFVRPMIIS